MTKLQLWSPLNDLWDLQREINRAFTGFGSGSCGTADETSMWTPAVDISEDKESVKLAVELAGMKKGDVKLNVQDGVLTLRGERTFADETKKDNYYRIERRYGTFTRSFTLPTTVDAERIQASMNHGVLEIMIPKREEAKPKEITIDVK